MNLSSRLQKTNKNLEKARRYFKYAALKFTSKNRQKKKLNHLFDLYYTQASPCKKNDILQRVNYYNKLNHNFEINKELLVHNVLNLKKTGSWFYHYDLTMQLAAFTDKLLFHYTPGDVQTVPCTPTFVKSRPISQGNENSILLKLNTIRHFNFVDDPFDYAAKKDQLVWRGACHQPHRRYFIEHFHAHPLCNVGDTNRDTELGKKPFMSIQEQLKYKFILSIEGNEVASNLKWIMASNSLCFMVQPKFETWFMEGLLIPNVHYVELKDDYSDLEDKINFYQKNEEAAARIIKNANDYVKPFLNHQRELLISHLVLQKYFLMSKQPHEPNYFNLVSSI